MCGKSWFFGALGLDFSSYRAAFQIPTMGPYLGIRIGADFIINETT
jgi:hypothetical protein